MPGLPMTPERYDALVRAFKEVGGPVFSKVAKIVGMDRNTVKKGWESGFAHAGEWARPISLIIGMQDTVITGYAKSSEAAQQSEKFATAAHQSVAERPTFEPDHEIIATAAQQSEAKRPTIDAPKSAKSAESDAGSASACVDVATVSPTPTNTSSLSKTDAKGLTPKQQKAREREEDAILSSINNLVGMSAITQRMLLKFQEKADTILTKLGTLGDHVDDPHAVKHFIEGFKDIAVASARNSEALLKVMEAARLNAGQAQSITENRNTEAPIVQGSAEALMERIAQYARVADTVRRGQEMRTHYHEDTVIDVQASGTLPPVEDQA